MRHALISELATVNKALRVVNLSLGGGSRELFEQMLPGSLFPCFLEAGTKATPPPRPPPSEILGELCAPGSLLLHSHTTLTIINLSPIVSSVSGPLSPPMAAFHGEPSSRSRSQSRSRSPVARRTCSLTSPRSTSPVGRRTRSVTRKMKGKGKYPPILLHDRAEKSGAASDIKKAGVP